MLLPNQHSSIKIHNCSRKLKILFYVFLLFFQLCQLILKDFFDSYYASRSTDEGKSEYYVDKHLYRNSQEEFIDTYPSPWDILSSLKSFQNNVQKFSELIMENKKQLPKSILIEFDIVESCLQDSMDNFQAVLDTENDNVQWSSFIRREFQPVTILNSAPLKVNHSREN